MATVIVGALGVEVAEELLAQVEMEVAVEDISEIVVPVDTTQITVEVVEEYEVTLDAC